MKETMKNEIREAYDLMNPTPEQEDRMLATLREAQADERGGHVGGETQVGGKAASGGTGFAARPARKRAPLRTWRVAVPIAACLVLGAVAIGVGALGSGAGTEADPASSTASGSATTSGKTLMTEEVATDSADLHSLDAMTLDAMTAAEADVLLPIDDFNTEEYAAVDENGFISTRTRPLSTVSADVDTASYANLRRLITQGCTLEEVPSGAVRVEEMLNYFTYGYAKPTGGELFSMQAQASACPWNPDTQLLTIGFATPYETEAAGKGANLVFLIDVSGSMDEPDKLELLQDSFATLLESLDGSDRVSIVTYSGHEEIVLEGAHGDDDRTILRAIYRLQADGSTNGEAGLKMAYEVAERNFIEGGVNRIVMASDGDLNVGATSESDLYDLVDGKRETGVYLSVLGFGSGNYKDAKMEVLADHGNGSYHYIDCAEEAERVLKGRLMANLVPFADDVKVQVEFNPAQVKGYRLIGYENRGLPDEAFRDDAADAGDVGPNAQFTVAYEVVPADSPYDLNTPDLKYGDAGGAGGAGDGSSSGSADWLTCSLRYRAFSDDAMHEQQLVVTGADSTTGPSDDWKFASAVIEFGMLASDSAYRGDLTCDSVLEILDALPLDAERESFRALVERAKEQSPVAIAGEAE